MTITARVAPFLFSACLLGMLATPLTAQIRHVHTKIEKEKVQKADALLKEALDLEASCDMNDWDDAAKLLVESAGLRPCHDPEIFNSLSRAARLYQSVGNLRRAEETMERAAVHAVYTGDVGHAADGYIALAWIAKARDDAKGVHNYLARAQDLAASPLLPKAKAQEIRSKIVDHVNGGG